MSTLPTTTENSPPTKPDSKPRPPRKRKPNYNLIHSRPLPLITHPLPNFHPSNPLSLLHLCYTYLSHLLSPPTSHPSTPYTGYWSPETGSVHVTDPKHARALWEMGFFGKGSLSRSEATWAEREREERERGRGTAAENATLARREERRVFKLERARVEREGVERQRRRERGEVVDEGEGEEVKEDRVVHGVANDVVDETKGLLEDHTKLNGNIDVSNPSAHIATEPKPQLHESNQDDTPPPPPIQDQEHLQLTPNEAFFLSYALGVLSIYPPPTPTSSTPQRPYTTTQLLHLFTSPSPPDPHPSTPAPDSPFLLSYTLYHHYRSLNWVPRPGTKFGTDFLLYARGPPFSHADFAVQVVPSYTHKYWQSAGGRGQRQDEGVGGQSWWRFHAVNRVQGAVKKTLVLAYVDVPSPFEVHQFIEGGEEGGRVDVGALLGAYRVREVVVRRWGLNRSRD